MKMKKTRLFILTGALAMLLAGCGDNDKRTKINFWAGFGTNISDNLKAQIAEYIASLSHKYNYINNENTVVKETTNIGSDTYVYTFTFKKENGKWKISYSDLSAISFNVLSIDSNIYDNIKVITH